MTIPRLLVVHVPRGCPEIFTCPAMIPCRINTIKVSPHVVRKSYFPILRESHVPSLRVVQGSAASVSRSL